MKGQSFWMLVFPLVLCLLTALAYLHLLLSTPDPLASLFLSLQNHYGRNYSMSHSPDAFRPRIELHPEDHIYRDPVTQHLEWVITSDNSRPDGVVKQVFLINGLFPGPTIEARSGDTLVISVTNHLEDKPFTIHWHGLHLQNSMDGASGVTQCPIAPGSKYIYTLTIPADQSGTFWYHAHTGISRADGLYGGFVVHDPRTKSTVRGLMADENRAGYDKEFLLLIGDWYHRQADQVSAWYMRSGSFGNEPLPDSLLINGEGNYDCSMAVPARPVDCIEKNTTDLSYLDLNENSAYRIRVVNTGSLAGYTMAFDHGRLRLLQLDGVDVEPQEEASSAGVLFPGQRMDAVLSAPDSGIDRSSAMTIKFDEEGFKYPNPALNPTQISPIITTKNTTTLKTDDYGHIDIEKVPSRSEVLANLPTQAQQTHVVYTKIQKLGRTDMIPYGFFNRTSWKPQSKPSIPLLYLPRDEWDENQLSISTGPEPVWVDLIVNNLDEGSHPFHLHGHHFYVLHVHKSSIGWGSYNPYKHPYPPDLEPSTANETDTDNAGTSPYNLSRAVLRDTVQIPTRGYAVLRFRAENPGVWLFHCHILWHLANGMAMTVDVMGDQRNLDFAGAECNVPM